MTKNDLETIMENFIGNVENETSLMMESKLIDAKIKGYMVAHTYRILQIANKTFDKLRKFASE